MRLARPQRFIAISVAFSWLSLVPVAVAAPRGIAKLAGAAHSYSKETGMPARRVPLATGGDRLFVAVTPQTLPSYLKALEGKAITWADPLGVGDRVHVPLIFGAGEQVTYAQTQMAAVGQFLPGTRLIPVAADKTQLAYMRGQIEQYGANSAAFLQAYPSRAVAKEGHQDKGRVGGGCMWLWVHMHAADDLPLQHLAGVNRCTNPPEMANRLVHAGNEHVGPIGLMISPEQVEQFAKGEGTFTDALILGELPQSGVEAVVRQ